MTVEIAEWVEIAGRADPAQVEDGPCDERCVWCEVAEDVAHTVDGFCEFCGGTSHPCA